MVDHKFWCFPGNGLDLNLNKYWNAFGVEHPDQRNLSITVEMNPPHHGEGRRTAGVFFTDSSGKFYIGHIAPATRGCPGRTPSVAWRSTTRATRR